MFPHSLFVAYRPSIGWRPTLSDRCIRTRYLHSSTMIGNDHINLSKWQRAKLTPDFEWRVIVTKLEIMNINRNNNTYYHLTMGSNYVLKRWKLRHERWVVSGNTRAVSSDTYQIWVNNHCFTVHTLNLVFVFSHCLSTWGMILVVLANRLSLKHLYTWEWKMIVK